MRYAAFQEMRTSRLLLRKLCMDDVPQFFERLGSSPKVTEHMLWEPHTDISESVASIRKVLKRYETGTGYRWGIALADSGELIGIIDLLHFDEHSDSCSFAYMLAEAFWNRGYATEALTAVLRFAFAELQISAVEADHFAENPASGAVMRKTGMTYQHTIPGKYEKHGIKQDAHVYRITRNEWLEKE